MQQGRSTGLRVWRYWLAPMVVAALLAAGCGTKSPESPPKSDTAPKPAAQPAAQPTPQGAEAIYAALAKLPPAERQKQLEEGARKEGKVVFYSTTSGAVNPDKLLEIFDKRYPSVKAELVKVRSQEASERFLAEEAAGKHIADVLDVGFGDAGPALARDLVAKRPGRNLPELRDKKFASADDRWVAPFFNDHGIMYNTKAVSEAEAPKDWWDLIDPKWQGKVSYDDIDPDFLITLENLWGEQKLVEWLQGVAKNKPIIQRGHTRRIELMVAGEFPISGETYLFYYPDRKKQDPNSPVGIVMPKPLMAWPAVSIISKNAPHPYAAALLQDWMFSQEAQDFLANQMHRAPTVKGTKHPYLPDGYPLVVTTPEEATPERIQKVMGHWNKIVLKQ